MASDTAVLVPSAPTPARGVVQLFGDAQTQRRSRRRARRENRQDRRDQRRRDRWEHQETLATIRNPPKSSDFPESNLATIADLFAGLFGGAGSISGGGPQPATGGEAVYIPGPEGESDSGGGINPAIIIVILAVGAGAYYWFVYRKKHQGGS